MIRINLNQLPNLEVVLSHRTPRVGTLTNAHLNVFHNNGTVSKAERKNCYVSIRCYVLPPRKPFNSNPNQEQEHNTENKQDANVLAVAENKVPTHLPRPLRRKEPSRRGVGHSSDGSTWNYIRFHRPHVLQKIIWNAWISRNYPRLHVITEDYLRLPCHSM